MPLFRSPIFWLGLFFLIFLGWCWRDSLRMETSFEWDGRELFRLRNAASHVEIYVAEGADSGRSYFRNDADLEERDASRFPRPAFQRAMIDDQPVYQAAVPHWLLVAAGGGVWLVLLGIRRSSVVRKRAGVP